MKRRRNLLLFLTALLLLPPVARAEGGCSHRWVLVDTQPATCTESGYELYRCSLCGAEKRETLAALGHLWSYCVTVTKPTCTQDGLIRCYCARDKTHYEDKVEPARGHAWGDWTVTKQATLNEWGVSERQCSRCGETEKSYTRPLAYRERYGLTLLLSPLPPEVRPQADGSLVLVQEVSLVNTGVTDLTVGAYSIGDGTQRALPEPLSLPAGQTVTFPLNCTLTAEEVSRFTAADGDGRLSLTLGFQGDAEDGTACASDQVPWTLTLPEDEWTAPPVQVVQALLSASANGAGYQLSETLRGRIAMTNGSDAPLLDIRLQAADAEPLVVEALAPGETTVLPWVHEVTLAEAVAGYAQVAWQAAWTEDGAARETSSNAIVVPVVSKLDLLVEAWPANTPVNGLYYAPGEEVRLRLRLRNNGAALLKSVTVSDPFRPDAAEPAGRLDQLRPGEEAVLEVPYTVTEADAQSGVLHVAATAQGYDPHGALHACTSGQVNLPTSASTTGQG